VKFYALTSSLFVFSASHFLFCNILSSNPVVGGCVLTKIHSMRKRNRITTRLQYWDYGSNADYFITICTANRQHFFGKIPPSTGAKFCARTRGAKSPMQLSPIGRIAESCWFEIPQHFPFVKLGAFVVMPNHIHGIITIDKEDSGEWTTNQFGPQSQNLASIVRGYKVGVTKNARVNYPEFAWHKRYYEHIIRNKQAYQRIKNYILNNPWNWKEDCFDNAPSS